MDVVEGVSPVGPIEKVLFEGVVGRKGRQSTKKGRKIDQAAYFKQESHGQ